MSYPVADGKQVSLDFEEWRPVIEFEDYYLVSSLGRIRSIGKRQGAKIGRILKQYLGGLPGKERYYVSLSLTAAGLFKKIAVHRVVSHAFIGPCPDGLEVNHIDGNRFNNRACNLEYITSKENNIHSRRMGLQKGCFTADDVRRIRKMLLDSRPIDIAKEYKVFVGYICLIRDGKTYAWVE